MPKPKPVYDARFVLHPELDLEYVHFEDAAAHPFQPRPSAVPRVNLWWLSEASLASYWAPDDASQLFRSAGLEAEYLRPRDVACYIAWQADWLLVACCSPESDEWNDTLPNSRHAQIRWDVGRVKSGFALNLDNIWTELESALKQLSGNRSVWFCGHSTGGALATLAAYRYGASGVCTLGCPRVGDPAFAAAFNAKLAGKAFRYVNNQDVVTHLVPRGVQPWLFEHVDTGRFIAADGSVSSEMPAISLHSLAPLDSPNAVAEMIDGLRSGSPMPAPTFFLEHMPKAYAIWMWNDYEVNG